jgi:hypothetical protein
MPALTVGFRPGSKGRFQTRAGSPWRLCGGVSTTLAATRAHGHRQIWQRRRDIRCPGGGAKQSSQKWPSRFCENTLRKQMNLSGHSLGNQRKSA